MFLVVTMSNICSFNNFEICNGHYQLNIRQILSLKYLSCSPEILYSLVTRSHPSSSLGSTVPLSNLCIFSGCMLAGKHAVFLHVLLAYFYLVYCPAALPMLLEMTEFSLPLMCELFLIVYLYYLFFIHSFVWGTFGLLLCLGIYE